MSGGEKNSAAMDYKSHDRTYEGFIDFSKVGSVACINILLALALVYQGHWILALIFCVFMLFTAAIGIFMRPGGFMAGVVQMGIGIVILIITAI